MCDDSADRTDVPAANTRRKLEDRAAYVEKQVLPWLTEHLKMRAVGFQVFPAVQAAIFIAYGQVRHAAIPFLGMAVCVSFLLWDFRNISVFRRLHKLAVEVFEDEFLCAHPELRGLHAGQDKIIGDGLGKSGPIGVLANLGSHSVALGLMVFAALAVWGYFAFSPLPPLKS